jgi:galactosylceramidase
MRMLQKSLRSVLMFCVFSLLALGAYERAFCQTIPINGADSGRTFDGIGGVSGGCATSNLLKDYPEPQRSQILDYLFKPDFGANLSALYVEVGGDCSTNGTEPSHMHTRADTNFQRGYEWWMINEAKKRNPDLKLNGCAWGCPGWIGNGNFWSQDMCDYYAVWIKGLKSKWGYDMNAIGCRNESGVNIPFVEMFRTTLDNDGLTNVKIHAFDNYTADKYDFTSQFATNAALNGAVDIIGAHTTWKAQTVNGVLAPAAAKNSGKPIYDTEEHATMDGIAGATNIVNACNENYIDNRITQVVFWFLVGSLPPVVYLSGYGSYPALMDADHPWCGYYDIKMGLWGFAHYGQFTKPGWQFLNSACGNFSGGGTHVALKSPDNADFSIIIETKGAAAGQTATFAISGGLPANKTLCVWRTNATSQFIRQSDITPTNGSFTITIDPNSIYSISTTTGQQKGSFTTAVPASKAFPFPYYENYDHYSDPKAFGYLPHYQADITGVFEITDRPDKTGKCLRQIVTTKASSWAPEWMPYSLIGDDTWTDYDVSIDVYFDNGGWASVMGRVPTTGGGYGSYPKGYYLRLASTGAWACLAAMNTNAAGTSLATGTVTLTANQWNNLKLRFSGTTITGFINNAQVFTKTDNLYGAGAVGFGTGDLGAVRNSALFDNLIVNTVGAAAPQPTVFPQDAAPIYGPSTGVAAQPARALGKPGVMVLKTIGSRLAFPKDFGGDDIAADVYDLKGKLVKKIRGKCPANTLLISTGAANEVHIVKLKATD